MKQISIILFFAFLILGCNAPKGQKENEKVKPNILFLAIDDLRPELGCYGVEYAKSPNLDKLADQGLLFNRAYCQEPICGPSRASIMTGARPETIGVVENFAYFRELNPEITTLSQQFIANGYEAAYVGKIFHGKHTDDELSWSRKPAYDKLNLKKPVSYALEKNRKIARENHENAKKKYEDVYGLGQGPAYECVDVPDETYRDGYNAQLAIATMKDMLEKNPDKPFFLGFGMYKPHLDWVAPKKYWDMYDPEEIDLADFRQAPENGAAMGLHASFELRVRDGIPKKGEIDDQLARKLRHAYLACVSYVDAQVGKILTALEEEGIRDNTIIIVWGDHGWHLGDKGIWGKATNYEEATRVPLMIWTPDMPDRSRGAQTDALVELVDMYPTLCDLAGISKPEHLEGQSFMPLLENPSQPWKKAVFSQFPCPALREWAANPLSKGMRETYFGPLIEDVEARIIEQQGDTWDRSLFENRLMGYGMRTDKYRFIVWKDYTKEDAEPVFIELYDHVNDPLETTNIADQKPKVVNQLLNRFNEGWKGNLAKVE